MHSKLKHSQIISSPDDHHKRKHLFESHDGKLKDTSIVYPDPPLHYHKNDYRIKVKNEQNKEHKAASKIKFQNVGSISLTTFDDSKNDTIIVTLSASGGGTCPAGSDTYLYYRNDTYFTNCNTSSFSNTELWYPLGGAAIDSSVPDNAITQDRLYAKPFCFPRGGYVNKLAIKVTSAPAARNLKLAIYDNTSDTVLYPNQKMFGDWTFSYNSTGIKTASTSDFYLIPNKLYWYALDIDASHNIGCISDAASQQILGIASSSWNNSANYLNMGIYVTYVYAALPATFPVGATISTGPTAGRWPAVLALFSA